MGNSCKQSDIYANGQVILEEMPSRENNIKSNIKINIQPQKSHRDNLLEYGKGVYKQTTLKFEKEVLEKFAIEIVDRLQKIGTLSFLFIEPSMILRKDLHTMTALYDPGTDKLKDYTKIFDRKILPIYRGLRNFEVGPFYHRNFFAFPDSNNLQRDQYISIKELNKEEGIEIEKTLNSLQEKLNDRIKNCQKVYLNGIILPEVHL